MSAENFAASLRKVLVHEGGYVNNPKDPGGATNKGVTQAVYDAWRTDRGLPRRPVSQLGDDELRLIYRGRFWDTIKGDDLPIGVDYVVFDGAVNSGPSQSAKWLQRALAIADDGKIGPQTIAAVRADLPAVIVDDILDQRLTFLKKIKHRDTGENLWKTFGKGWQRRVDEVRRDAMAMIAASSGQQPRQEPAQPQPDDPGPETPPADRGRLTPQERDRKGLAGLVLVILAAVGTALSKILGLW